MHSEDDLTTIGESPEDGRQFQFRRFHQPRSGRVYFPATEEEAVCTIDGISATGARLSCALSRPATGQVILYSGNLGRIEGQVLSTENDGFIMSFSCSRKRRDRLADQLTVELNRHLLKGVDCADGEPEKSESYG